MKKRVLSKINNNEIKKIIDTHRYESDLAVVGKIQPFVIAMVGMPASGRTLAACLIARELGAIYLSYEIIRSVYPLLNNEEIRILVAMIVSTHQNSAIIVINTDHIFPESRKILETVSSNLEYVFVKNSNAVKITKASTSKQECLHENAYTLSIFKNILLYDQTKEKHFSFTVRQLARCIASPYGDNRARVCITTK
jgi:hypothetical protein